MLKNKLDVNEDAALDNAVNALGLNDSELLNDDDVTDLESAEDEGTDVLDSDAGADDLSVDDDEADDDAESDEDESEAEDDDDESEDDAEDEESDEEDPKAGRRNRKFEIRIGKEVSKRKAAEANADALKAEVQDLHEQLAEGKAKGRFDGVVSLADVAKARRDLRRELDVLEDGIADGELVIDGKTYDVAKLREWRREVRDELEEAIPAVERRITRRNEVNRDLVAKVYPDLLDAGSDLRKQADSILNRVPGLMRDPEALLLVGDMLRGRRLRMGAKAKGTNAKKSDVARTPPRDSGKGAGTRRVVRAPKGRSEDGDFISKMAELARERQMV